MKQFITITILILFLTGCKEKKGSNISLPSLNETYDRLDKKPFGGFVAYHHTKLLLGDSYIETITEPFNETWNKMVKYDRSKPSLYILIAKNLILNEVEVDAMMAYVGEGNDLFISADYIDDVLLKRMGVRSERDSQFVKEANGFMTEAFVRAGNQPDSNSFNYYYYPFLNHFFGFGPAFTRVLGVNQAGQPNYLVKFFSSGRIYLHAGPRSFGNYFLLKNDNHAYLEKVVSYWRSDPDNIYWDGYYQKKNFRRKSDGDSGKNGNDEEFSSFKVIMNNPALRAAFWLALVALLLYVFFNIKRKQRIIKVIPPLANNTVVFTETVGRLYLQKKNNKNIAEKMITYFYEHIRNKYFLNTLKINEDLIISLSGKSGMEINNTRELFNRIKDIQDKTEVNDTELLALNNSIQNFYKYKS